jgi:Na+-translocating ferredoxin:NAD+ oxidoreductase RnfG subunit
MFLLSNGTLFTILMAFVLLFAASGCNEAHSQAVVEKSFFPASSVVEKISANSRGIEKVNRYTDSRGKTIGYTAAMEVVSRSGPFEILVVLDSKACVKTAEVKSYRAQRGRKVRSKAFTRQFSGKCPGDPIELGVDIDAISGATLSSGAMTKGVKKAVDYVRGLSR